MDYKKIGFEPTVDEVVRETDLGTGEVKQKYKVTVQFFGKERSATVYISSLHNIQWYERFGCPDAHLSKKDKRELEYKMQCEAADLIFQKEFLCSQGLQFYEETVPVYVFGDRIFSTLLELDGIFRIKQEYHLKNGKENRNRQEYVRDAKRYISLIPEVTPVIFYASLLSVVKPILVTLYKNIDFVIAVIGPKGHLKTSLVKLYALWLDGDVQKVDFTSNIRIQEIERKIALLAGQNLLLDDLHAIDSAYKKSRMKDKLDSVVRFTSNNACSTNVFVTGESIKDMAIFSTRDRTLQVSVPQMDGTQLNNLKDEIGKLSDYFMTGLSALFVDSLVKNYDRVVKDIECFLDGHKSPAYLDGSTRISDHVKYVKLTEFLYCKYLCGGMDSLSGREYLEEVLKKQAKIQQEELLEQEDETNIDYVMGIYDILNAEGKYINMITQRELYNAKDEDSCLVWDGKVYITGDALRNAVWKYYQRTIRIRDVVSALHDVGVLEEDRDARTKKYKGVRHYVVSYRALLLYYSTKARRE